MFVLALVFGTVCVVKTYEAYDWLLLHHRRTDTDDDRDPDDDEDYVIVRTVAIGTGTAATLCFIIATLSSFYAGMRHTAKSDTKKKKMGGGGCLGGLVIAGWIVFCLTFINDLIILVLAFDGKNAIYPEVVWTALVGSILSWMFMFGYSEVARRS